MANKSALYRVTRNLIRVVGSGAKKSKGEGEGRPGSPVSAGRPLPGYRTSFDPDRPTFDHDRFVELEARRMALCLKTEEKAFSDLVGRVVPVVTNLTSKIEAGGARCIVMVIPDQYQVDAGLVDQVLQTTGNRLEDYDLDRPQRTFVGELESAGVEVLDLLSVFRATTGETGLYRPRDTHWNRRGNAVAAVALVDLVASRDRSAIFTDGMETGDASAWGPAEGQ